MEVTTHSMEPSGRCQFLVKLSEEEAQNLGGEAQLANEVIRELRKRGLRLVRWESGKYANIASRGWEIKGFARKLDYDPRIGY